MSLEWFTVLFGVFTGVIGYFGRMFYDHKNKLRDKAAEERREVYKKFIDIVVDGLHNQSNQEVGTEADLSERMFDFYKKYLLYATPDVINALGEYQQHVMHQDPNNPDIPGQYRKYAKVIYEMREDLGLSVKKLGQHGEHVFKTMLVNYYDLFPERN